MVRHHLIYSGYTRLLNYSDYYALWLWLGEVVWIMATASAASRNQKLPRPKAGLQDADLFDIRMFFFVFCYTCGFFFCACLTVAPGPARSGRGPTSRDGNGPTSRGGGVWSFSVVPYLYPNFSIHRDVIKFQFQ